ncbi:hypothetical protein EDD18DRAFT_1106492 [Armillaria luteobubalina]|uniref:Ribonuclease H1 N-terminal domain-containing protein n=1 Tax=Armillaria luteobubalina TaxID=153913 RepID=A0AA39Q2X7_9AGAR|nr:hypothetical protein EDD18DRAFT_1106492 [Armillaria luteobubalina]
MPRTPSAVPAQSAVTSASDFVSLMATLANLNLSNGTTLMTTMTTTNSLHLPTSSAGVGALTLPTTAASTTSIGSPSTTTSISLTTATTPTARTTTNTTPTEMAPAPAHAEHRVYHIPSPKDLPCPPTVWPPHNNFYVITCGQEVGIFFTWTETAERVIGVPGNVYEWKNNYYDAVNVYRQAYNKEQVHVTPLASSCFDVSIEDEWGSLDWGSNNEDSFVAAMSQA